MEDLLEYYRVKAEIDLDAVYNNALELKKCVSKDTLLAAVIKTDGYGHGAVPIAKTIDNLVESYAVATIDEALNLRNHGIKKDIFILGYVHKSCYKDLIENDIIPVIFTYEMAEILSKQAELMNKTIRVNIKLDTGMNRIGFLCNDKSISDICKISKLKNIKIWGISTHFASSDVKDKTFAEKQLNRYNDIVEKLKNNGVEILIKHCSNSAAIIDMPQANFDMVRAGIALYGLIPSDEVNLDKVNLLPALSLKSHVVHVKEVKAGEGISYGSTFITDKVSKIATIPVGYGDGYPRNLSNKGYVLINGKKYNIVGRVCMDQFMVDVTDSDVKTGDEVILIGRDKNENITVEELAQMALTFNYEFVCDLGKRIPRVFIKSGKIVCKKDYFNDKYLVLK